jgi:hypothetical protein
MARTQPNLSSRVLYWNLTAEDEMMADSDGANSGNTATKLHGQRLQQLRHKNNHMVERFLAICFYALMFSTNRLFALG